MTMMHRSTGLRQAEHSDLCSLGTSRGLVGASGLDLKPSTCKNLNPYMATMTDGFTACLGATWANLGRLHAGWWHHRTSQ